MRIWYFNHYATPPAFGFSGRGHYLGRYFKQNGSQFINFCASFHHLKDKRSVADVIDQVKIFDGVPYYHIQTIGYSGNNVFRVFNMLEYATRAARLDCKIRNGELDPPDVVIASCAHIFSYLAASRLKKKRNLKIIYEVRDLWPLSLVELLGLSRFNPLVMWMKRIERKAYSEADAVVSTLSNAIAYMEQIGIENKRFHFIPNGYSADDWLNKESRIPEEHEREFVRCRNNGKLIVVYAGSHGPPNALDQILRINEVVKTNDVPYHFVLVGDGTSKEELIKQTEKYHIHFISFLPKVPQSAVPAILNSADVCFIGWQKKNIYKYGISPNKMCDYLMSGKPILHALDTPDDPVVKANAGISVEPYNPHQLNEALNIFCSMPAAEREAMGQRGKEYALKHLEYSVIARKYYNLCTNLVGEK
jgi:glycosyltransferase involved in cell wall biosynthesis